MSAGTVYGKRYAGGFLDLPTTTTPIDSAFLNAVEVALLQLIGAAPNADGQVAQWDNVNTRYGPALLLNKNIDPAAAIVKSKLDFTGANGITNADIAAAAAIARSKLDFGSGLVNADIAAAAAIVLSKLADPGSGNVVTSAGAGAIAAKPPGFEYAYNQITGNVSITATTEGTANTIVTASAVTFDGATPVLIEFFSITGVTPGTLRLWLYDGAASIGQIAELTGTSGNDSPLVGRVRITPAAATKTYSIRGSVASGTGTIAAGAGGIGVSYPTFIRITKA